MSRMRQIPVMDITQREKIMQQNNASGYPNPNIQSQPDHYQTMYNTMRPAQINHRPRGRRVSIPKFRLSDTPALITGGCNSVREFCNNIQTITMDLNNLIGSVESMVPLLNTYLTVLQSRSAIVEQERNIPIDVRSESATPIHHSHTAEQAQAPCTNNQSQQNSTPTTAPMPRPEDIQTLLANPLVRNLLNGFMQNGAIPNANLTKETTPNQ